MKRDFLKALGLDDETIGKVMDEHSRGIGAEVAKTTAATEAKKALEDQLKQRDSDIESLKTAANGHEELKQKLQALQDAAGKQKSEYDQKLKIAAARAEIGDTVHDTDLYLSLVDMAKIELDDNGTIKAGLKEQREAIDKAKPFLLKQQQAGGGKPTGYRPADGAQAGGSGEINPFDPKTFNLTEQGKIFKADPQKARALAEAAGVQL